MNRKEAIEVLTKTAEELKFLITDHLLSRSTKVQYIDLIDAVERLSGPLTLIDLLGLEEGVEYEWRNEKYKICDDILQCYDKNDDRWYDSVEEINDYLRLQQATKLEPKLKAYHVKDEYSYDCLMQELEEQGYVCVNGFPLSTIRGYEDEYPYVIEKENKKIMRAEKDDHNFYGYDLIEYHKEEPLYYAIDRIGKLDNDNSYYLVRFYDEFSERYYFGNTGKESADKLTKTEWNKLGINDTNVDFERAG